MTIELEQDSQIGDCRHNNGKGTHCSLYHHKHQQVLLGIQLFGVVKRQSGRKDSHHLFECPSTKILMTDKTEESGQAQVDENVVDEQRQGNFKWQSDPALSIN